jgi:23S rRNA pseudouridine1911/1915/1917 synthase
LANSCDNIPGIREMANTRTKSKSGPIFPFTGASIRGIETNSIREFAGSLPRTVSHAARSPARFLSIRFYLTAARVCSHCKVVLSTSARNNSDESAARHFVMNQLFEILFEDDELLVINKPAGLVCHPTKTDERSSLIGRVRLHLGADAHPHLINRLDRETSGVILVAKRDDAARELRRQWESRVVQKEYLAIVHGHVRDESGLIDAPLGKDEHSRVAIKDCVRPDGAPAQTEFCVEHRFTRDLSAVNLELPQPAPSTLNPQPSTSPFTLLRVRPRTGRKHQIRIHLAHLGHPIVGDKLYGDDEDLYLGLVEDRLTPEQQRRLILSYHALHARMVRLLRNGVETEFSCEPESWFRDFSIA